MHDTIAPQIMYGWRCFEYDSRIEDEQPAKEGTVKSSAMGKSVRTGTDGINGNADTGNGLDREEKGG